MIGFALQTIDLRAACADFQQRKEPKSAKKNRSQIFALFDPLRCHSSRTADRLAAAEGRAGLPSDAPRAGQSLTEVLMSLAIMGIGIIALATLFPISVLRTIQATQLTNATILRYNAEAFIDAIPDLIHDPDRDGNRREHVGKKYMVDPLGYAEIAGPMRDTFGNTGGSQPKPVGKLTRYHGGYQTEARAARLVTLPDSWLMQVDDVPEFTSKPKLPLNSVRLAIEDFSASVPYTNNESRVVLFDSTGRMGQVRNVTNVTGTSTSTTVSFLPSVDFVPERVRVESFDRRYTWLLTVRKGASGTANVDVVVFFSRSVSTEDERVYNAKFWAYDVGPDGKPGVAGYDDDQNGTVDDNTERGPQISPGKDGQPGKAGFDDDNNGVIDDGSELGWPGTDDLASDDVPNSNVTVTFPASSPPFFKRGGYVLNTTSALWYRIQNIEDETNTSVELALEEPIKKNGSGAILMRGVIAVYPLGTRIPR